MNKIWVIEISIDDKTWLPTNITGLTREEANIRKLNIEHQAEVIAKAMRTIPIYRIRIYKSSE